MRVYALGSAQSKSGITIEQVGDSLDKFVGSFPGPQGEHHSPRLASSSSKLVRWWLRMFRFGPVRLHCCDRAFAGTPYEGGRFVVDIEAPPTYPFSPLKMKFRTKVSSRMSRFEVAILLIECETDLG